MEQQAVTDSVIAKRHQDWERIEGDYRAAVKTLREIAAEHGITEGAIRKRAKRDGWERDLSAKIQAKADSLVRKSEVRSEVRNTATEREIVDSESAMQAAIRISHRKDIARGRCVVSSLLAELELECGPENAALLSQLGEMMAQGDEQRMSDAYRKIISLQNRTKAAKELGESLAKMVALEREAFRMDSAPADPVKSAAEGAAAGALAALPGMDALRAKFDAVLGR